MKYLHYFDTSTEFNAVYDTSLYTSPWASYTADIRKINYSNKYRDLLNTPLTFEILSDGVLIFYHSSDDEYNVGAKTIQYRKNGGSLTSVTSTSNKSQSTGVTICEVQSGDIVELFGDNYNGYAQSAQPSCS